MQFKSKNFKCVHCEREQYTQEICYGCGENDFVRLEYKNKSDSDRYKCYLNSQFYGGGDLKYMRELFVDYVILHQMYGKDEIDFRIVKCK